MSITKIKPAQKKCRGTSWETAIEDAGILLNETTEKEVRHELELAIDWFKYRLAMGAPYPGMPTPDGVTH